MESIQELSEASDEASVSTSVYSLSSQSEHSYSTSSSYHDHQPSEYDNRPDSVSIVSAGEASKAGYGYLDDELSAAYSHASSSLQSGSLSSASTYVNPTENFLAQLTVLEQRRLEEEKTYQTSLAAKRKKVSKFVENKKKIPEIAEISEKK